MTQSSYEERLLSHLNQLDSRGYAVLRRAAAEPCPHDYVPAFAYLEPFLANTDESTRFQQHLRKVVYLFASLYCLVNRSGEPPLTLEKPLNLGYTLALLHREKYPEKSTQPTSLEQRFLVLLDSDEEQRAYFLRQMLMLLKAEPIHWEQLFKDIRSWNDNTRQNWASQFYQNH